MNVEQAETLALEALMYIIADEELFSALVAQTGAEADTLKRGAGDPVFLGSVLDFLLEDERRVVAFCNDHEVDPQFPAKARLALPGATAGIW